MPRPERLPKSVSEGPGVAFAEEETENFEDQGHESERGKGEHLLEMLRRIREAEKEAETALEEEKQIENQWSRMSVSAGPELVQARKIATKEVSLLERLRSRTVLRIGRLVIGLDLLIGAQIAVVAAGEGKFTQNMSEEADPDTKALVRDVERVARRLVTIEERYAPSIVGATRRFVSQKDAGEQTHVSRQGQERLPDANAEQYERFSREADNLVERTIREGNVPQEEDAETWLENVLDPLMDRFEASEGVTINLHEGPVNLNWQQMLRNYIHEIVDANPERASLVAEALEPGDGYRLAIQRHDGKVAAARLREYLQAEDETIPTAVEEGAEHLRWVLPHMSPIERAHLLDLLNQAVNEEQESDLFAEMRQNSSRIRAAIRVIESMRR